MAIDVIANPSEKGFWEHTFVLWFDSHAATNVLVYANSLDDALEEAAQVLREKGWTGLFTEPDYKDAFEDLQRDGEIPEGITFEDIATCGMIDEVSEKVLCAAEADLTYTESGHIASWEWGIVAEDPSKKELIDIAHGFGESYGCTLHGFVYSDGSVWTGPTSHNHPMAKDRVRPASMCS